MAMTSGFNSELVRTSISKVVNSSNDLMKSLKEEMGSKFISPMGDAWACKEAVDFFASLKETLDDLIKKSDSVFQSVVDTMNQGAKNWAISTGNEGVFSPVSYHNYAGRTDVGMIKENIGGERGINKGAADSATATLASIKASCDKALTSASQAVDSCGFIGGSQAENLKTSLNEIKTNISNSFDEYVNSTKKGIDETITKYGNIETTNAGTFVAK